METTATLNRKTKYYLNHKDDEDFKARMREAKRRYYQKNRDTIIQKALDRYYASKTPANPPEQTPQIEA